MKPLQTLIVALSAAAALAVGLGAQAEPTQRDRALLHFLQGAAR